MKSYALFDVIGTSDSGDNSVFEKFWSAVEGWTNYEVYEAHNGMVRSNKHPKVILQSNIQVVAFSDSALLTTRNEYLIDDFYGNALDLKKFIQEHTGCSTFCIISRGLSIEPSMYPSTGFRLAEDLPPSFVPIIIRVAQLPFPLQVL